MKRILNTLIYSLAAAALLLSSAVWSAEIKIGVVNTARVLKEAPQAELARKKLESEFAPRDLKIVDMQKKIRQLEENLAKNASIMSEAKRKSLEREIISEKRDVKRNKEEFTEDLNIRRNEELNKLQKLVYDSIVNLAKELDYDIILSESVLFANKRVDLTEQVLQRLKKDKQ